MSPRIEANQLVREAVRNELQVTAGPEAHWKYRELNQKDGKEELRDVIDTKQGEISRLLALDSEPLTPEQKRMEDVRIQKLAAHPEEVQKQKQEQEQDNKKETQLLQSFPSAFLYRYAGTDRGLVKMEFVPNPRYRASTREEQVFHHMSGAIWIDARQTRLARLEGILTSQVEFGGGLLGHLDKGGTFSVSWKDLGAGQWGLESLDVQIKGKALLFKTISVQQKERCTNYERIPDGMTLEKAAQLLRNGSETLAQPHSRKSGAEQGNSIR